MTSTFCYCEYTFTVLHARALRLFQNIYKTIKPYNHDKYILCVLATRAVTVKITLNKQRLLLY